MAGVNATNAVVASVYTSESLNVDCSHGTWPLSHSSPYTFSFAYTSSRLDQPYTMPEQSATSRVAIPMVKCNLTFESIIIVDTVERVSVPGGAASSPASNSILYVCFRCVTCVYVFVL